MPTAAMVLQWQKKGSSCPVGAALSWFMSLSAAARRDAWSRYWARGAPHSCVGTYGENYGGAIGEFWREVFTGLPAVARVLDVATGNGALPRLLLEHCHMPGVHCDAVDIAAVRPPWLAALTPADRERVRLHGGVDAAALPFGDRRFDLIVSQYGLEYTDLETTLPELLRVRAPGGGVAMVLHHAQGRPATLAKLEIDHLTWLTRENGLLDTAAALVEPMARAATPQGRIGLQNDLRANAARERFNDLQGQVTQRAAHGDGADVLHEVRDAVMSVFSLTAREGAAVAGTALAALREEFAAAATRLHDLCTHALDVGEAQALRERLASALGVSVSLGELREQAGYLMGWTIHAPAARQRARP